MEKNMQRIRLGIYIDNIDVGKYVSIILNVAAAITPINIISSHFTLVFGIAYTAIETIKPINKYLLILFTTSI